MGGGDLNTKKSWHPNTIKNQERVWKAEQQEAAEKRKLADLQREINDERNREDLKNIAKKAGYINNDEDKKLEWMYKGPQQLLNREEYLLGRQIDKNFEQLDQIEKDQQRSGITVPKNHVEHECVPFSIRQYKNVQSTEQVDMARKLMEDPLMAIKQREIESRQKILENPVKLKELHRLLKNERDLIETKSKKKDKKNKKSKKKSKNDSSDDEKNLDQLLAQKYKKLQGSIKDDEDSQDMSLDKLLSKKYNLLSKELGKMAKKKKNKKRSKSSDSDSDSESDKDTKKRNERRSSSEEANQNSKKYDRPNDYGRNRDNFNKSSRHRSRSMDRSDNRDYRQTDESYNNRNRDYRGARDNYNNRNYSRDHNSRQNHRRSPNRVRDRSRSLKNEKNEYSNRNSGSYRHNPIRKESISAEDDRRDKNKTKKEVSRKRTPESTSSSDSPVPRKEKQNDSDDEGNKYKKKNFGLVTAKGEQISITSKEAPKFYSQDELRAIKATQKPTWTKPEKKKLTDAEMEQKRLEMLKNAEWREKDREQKIKRYNDEEKREADKNASKEFDHNFLNKQLRKAAENETVESRIKSNLNNIQRSSRAMDSNFARR